MNKYYSKAVLVYNVSQKKFTPRCFLELFFQWLRLQNQNFTCLLYFYVYFKLPNFIQCTVTLTKLYHTEHDRPVNFYISLDKTNHKKITISLQQYDHFQKQ